MTILHRYNATHLASKNGPSMSQTNSYKRNYYKVQTIRHHLGQDISKELGI